MSIDHQSLLPLLPEKPGIYQFLDEKGMVLYVGKAGNLKKRVSSYFSKNQTGKTTALLRRAQSLIHTVVESESEALLLENNLIKKHQPRYNILLKDDKTYPWICIRNEPFPRVFSTRNIVHDGSEYFGPYTSVVMVRTLLSLIRKLYQLRTCSLVLTQENIKAGKFRVCLEYQIGNCRGPCEGLQSEKEYNHSIDQIRDILKGNIRSVADHLRGEMLRLSASLEFEAAQRIKEKLEIISTYRSKSVVVNPDMGSADVFGFSMEGDYAAVNFLRVVEGAVVQTFTIGLKRKLEESPVVILALAIGEVINRIGALSREIIVPFKPEIHDTNLKITVPSRGDKRKLLEMAERNSIYFRLEQKKKAEGRTPADRTAKNLERLKKDLHMSSVPRLIECFDNSNIQGSNPVASCVVFRNGKPARSEYRHFNIRGVSGPDDYASMEEVVFRRYRRKIEEGKPLPDLVVIDGGKGQLSSAMISIDKLGIRNRMAVIGIAKRLEEIYFPGDSIPLYIDKNSVSLKIIQHIRNEAHRFGVSFHRLKRSGEMLKSEFDMIPGIGPQSVKRLLEKFGSLTTVARSEVDDLAKIVGRSKAEAIRIYFLNKGDVSRET